MYYDGDCALCNWAVARCLARGVPSGVRFASQDGELFRRLCAMRPDLASVDSMVVQSFPAAGAVAAAASGTGTPAGHGGGAGAPNADEAAVVGAVEAVVRAGGEAGAPNAVPRDGTVGEVRLRGDAVIWLASRLRGPDRWLARLLRLLPRPVRDGAYRLVARNRRRVSGRLPACPVPTPEQRRYFLA